MEQPNVYEGKHIILSSDRLVLIGRDNDILLNSKKTIGLQTNDSIHLDSGKFVIMNSPTIYLGLKSVDKSQPVLRGGDFKDVVYQLMEGLNVLINAVEKTPGAFPSTFILGIGYLKGVIQTIKTNYGGDLNKTLSKKTYVE